MDEPLSRHPSCTRCGTCCRWPGYVRLRADEADAIARYLDLEPRDFIERYAAVTADRRSLTLVEGEDGACVMLGGDSLCRINPVKPRQCRDFPERWRAPGYDARCPACSRAALAGDPLS